MHTPDTAPSRTKQLIFFGILVTAGVLVSLLTVYKLSVANAYRVYEVETAVLPVPTDAASVARGMHLTKDVMACQSCHGADLGGQVLMDNARAVVTAPNLTVPRTDETWVRALRLGVDGEGRPLWVMPSRAHSALNDQDLTAIVASVRARPQVTRALPQSHLRFWGNWAVAARQLRLIQTGETRIQTPDAGTPAGPTAAYGGYLAQVMQCTSCHTAPHDAAGPKDVAMGPASMRDAATFHHALTGQHTTQKLVPGVVAWPQGGFARLTNVEFEALWRYFQGA